MHFPSRLQVASTAPSLTEIACPSTVWTKIVFLLSLSSIFLCIARLLHKYRALEPLFLSESEIEERDVDNFSRLFNSTVAIISGLIIPFCGMYGAIKKKEWFIQLNQFGSGLISLWNIFSLLIRVFVTDFYKKDQTSFVSCEVGRTCFHVFIILSFLWSLLLLFCVIADEYALEELIEVKKSQSRQDSFELSVVEANIVNIAEEYNN